MKKKTIIDMHQLAVRRGGRCLASKYINSRTALLWECVEGHQWRAIPASIQQGSWCMKCHLEKRRNGIERMMAVAADRGGKCLSREYTNANSKLLFECGEGHQWWAKPNNILNGSWCRVCAGMAPNTIENAQQLASAKGGRCLSLKISNAHSKLYWECFEGHSWKATYASIQQGSWCPVCAGLAPKTINDAQELGQSRKLECLSTSMCGTKSKLKWRCLKCFHEWKARYNDIYNGSGCPVCAGKIVTYKEVKTEVELRGGELLSEVYTNNKTKLKIRCADGHTFSANWNSIQQGSWCPRCTRLVNENICRQLMEIALECEFPKVRPDWLFNPKSGYKLELDGFNEEKRIAFEYHGEQHTKPIWGRSSFKRTINSDEIKKRICPQRGVMLLIIGCCKTGDVKALRRLLIQEYKSKGLDSSRLESLNLHEIEVHPFPQKLVPLKEKVNSHKGKLLTSMYLGINAKYRVKCKCGHIWSVRGTDLMRGHWCAACARKS